MAFINKQEEVIQIKLTPFGRSQLSKGNFRPVYYAFFDDDILYDGSHIGIDEEQNEIETRIKNSVRLDLQPTSIGVETSYKKETEKIEKGERDLFRVMHEVQNPSEKSRSLSCIMGAASYESQHAPSYNIKSLGGAKFTGDVLINTSSHGSNIPQVTLESQYVIDVNHLPTKVAIQDFETQIDLISENIEFLDGTSLRMEKDEIILQVLEENVNLTKEMFDIEIYEVQEVTLPNGDKEEKLVSVRNIEDLFNISTDKTISKYNQIQKDLRKGLFTGR